MNNAEIKSAEDQYPGSYQHNATPTATRTAKTLPPNLSCTLMPPLDPPPPCEKPLPLDPVDDDPAAPLAADDPDPLVPDPELSSFRTPAPETPGTDSGVALGFAEDPEAWAFGSRFGLSPLANSDLSTTSLSEPVTVSLVPAASLYLYAFPPENLAPVGGW